MAYNKPNNNLFINTKRISVTVVEGFDLSFELTIGGLTPEGIDPALVATKLNEDLPALLKQITDALELTTVRTDKANASVRTDLPSEFMLTTERKIAIAERHVEVASDAPF